VKSKKRRFTLSAAVVLIVSLVFAAVASGDHGRGDNDGHDGRGAKLFRSSLAPSVPTDPKFHNVTAGGVPWSLDRGSVSITSGGRFDVRLEGLLITGTNNPGPVKTVSASLFCGADTDAAPAVTTDQVPLSSTGDARIRRHVTLPASCLAPIVLVHPNGGRTRYIAVSGWKS
jgi:hypothetical protein